ncbi:MAG TPA: recombinase family protein [Woeseiaceae bacterium]|nr:recombinase family protein [Woeseiaceae bacterium]
MTNQDTSTTRAAVYLRISQDKTGEAAGVTRQREDCLALVKAQGWQLYDTYVDNDISASSGKARPNYKRLLADIKDGQVDAIVAWHPDRLYRKLTDLEGLIAAIESRNVIMRTVRAGEIDLSTPTGRMLARILSATAQAEGEVKADRWMRSWRQGREAGLPARTGSRLFGYTRAGELVPGEAEIMRDVAARLLAGETLLSLTEQFEDAGISTTRGTVWRTGTLRQYLANPRIAGWSTLKGEILGEGQWEPVLDRETWEAVKVMLDARSRPYVPRKALLNGLIFCECGQRIITSGQRKIRTYRCPNRPGMRGCGKVSGNAEPIEEFVEAFARARLDDPRVRARLAALRNESPQVRQELAAIELRITELEQQLDQPGVPVATILRAIDRTKDRRADLAATLGTHAAVSIPEPGSPWPDDLQTRRALVDLVVRRVTLLPATRSGRQGFNPERVQIDPR